MDVVLLDGLDEGVRVDKVGVGVSSTKVGKRNAVLDGRFGKTESLDEDSSTVWAGDTVQTVKEDLEIGVRLEEGFNEREVEDAFEEDEVVLDRVDDFNFERTVFEVSKFREVELAEECRSGCLPRHARVQHDILTSPASRDLYELKLLVIS